RETSISYIISDEEKALFERADIELSPSSWTLARDERFVFYLAITRATEGLYHSWSVTLPSGDVTKRSPFLDEVMPPHPERVRNYEYRRVSECSGFNPDRPSYKTASLEPG